MKGDAIMTLKEIKDEHIKTSEQRVENIGSRNVSSINTTVNNVYNEIRGDLRYFVGKIVEVGETEKLKQVKQYLEDKRELVLSEIDKDSLSRDFSDDLVLTKTADLISSVIKQIDEKITAREEDKESDKERAEKIENDNNQNKEDANEEKEKIKDQEAVAEKTSDIKEVDSEPKQEDISPDNDDSKQEDESQDSNEDRQEDRQEDNSPDKTEDKQEESEKDSEKNQEDKSTDKSEDKQEENKEDNEKQQEDKPQEDENEEQEEESEDDEEESDDSSENEDAEKGDEREHEEKSSDSDKDYDEEEVKGQGKEKGKDSDSSETDEDTKTDVSASEADTEDGLLAFISSIGGGDSVEESITDEKTDVNTNNNNDDNGDARGDDIKEDSEPPVQDDKGDLVSGSSDDSTPIDNDKEFSSDKETEVDSTVPEEDAARGDDITITFEEKEDSVSIQYDDDAIPESDITSPDDVIIADASADIQSSDIISPEETDVNNTLEIAEPETALEDNNDGETSGPSASIFTDTSEAPTIPVISIDSPQTNAIPDNENNGNVQQDNSFINKLSDIRSTINEINDTLQPFKTGAQLLTGDADTGFNILKSIINTGIAAVISSATGIPVWLAKPLVEIAETALVAVGAFVCGAIASIFDSDSDFWSNLGHSIKDFFTGLTKPIWAIEGLSESDLAYLSPDSIPEHVSFFNDIKANITDITIDSMYTTENDLKVGDYDFEKAQDTLRELCGYDMSAEKFMSNLDSSSSATFVLDTNSSSFDLGDIVKGTSLDPQEFESGNEASRYSDLSNQPSFDSNIENILQISYENPDLACVFDSVCFDYTDTDICIDLVDSVDFYVSEYFDYSTITSFYMSTQDEFYGEAIDSLKGDASNEEFRNFANNIDNPYIIQDIFGNDKTAERMADTFESSFFASGTDMADTFNNLIDRIEGDVSAMQQREIEQRDRENGIEQGMTFREIERAQQEVRDAETLKEQIELRNEEPKDNDKEDSKERESDSHEPDRKDNERVPERRESDYERDTDSHQREKDTSSEQPQWKVDYSRRGYEDDRDRESDTSSSRQSANPQRNDVSDDSSSASDR